MGVVLLDAVGNEIDHIQARYALLVEVVHRVGVFLAKDGNQYIGTRDFFFTIAGGLHVHDGALNYTLKTQSGLGVHLIGAGHLWRVVFDEV